MTPLRPDCPDFEPDEFSVGLAPAEAVALQLAGPLAELYAEEIRAAAAAVVYFFRHDLGRSTVSVSQFAATLRKALAGLGLSLELSPKQGELSLETDLADFLEAASKTGELRLFARLRQHLRQQLRAGAATIRYCGLRPCVRQALGTRRWTPRCQRLADQIVSFLRACLAADGRGNRCVLLVR